MVWGCSNLGVDDVQPGLYCCGQSVAVVVMWIVDNNYLYVAVFWLGLKIDRVSPLIYVGDEWAIWRVVQAYWFDICSRPTNNLN